MLQFIKIILNSVESHFLFHIIKQTIIFIIWGAALFGVQKYIELIELSGGNKLTIYSLTIVKIFIIIGEIVWFATEILPSIIFRIKKAILKMKNNEE